MTDKELIKQEIERLKTQNETYLDKEYSESTKWYKHGAYDTCFQLLNFIDSLPEKLVKETIKGNYNERYNRIVQTEQFKKTYCDKSLGKEESCCEDLEEELHSWMRENCDDNGFFNQLELASHFAEWQKQQDEKLFKDDSWNYIEENYPNISQEEKLRLYDISIKSRLAGANAIKQKMVKDAIDATTLDIDSQTIEFGLWPEKLLDIKEGDKVKIIILK